LYAAAINPGTTLHAIRPDGTEKWVFDAGARIYSSPAIGADGTIYFGTLDDTGLFFAIRPDGTELWRRSAIAEGAYVSPAIASDGTLFFGADRVYHFTPAGDILWEFRSVDGVGSSPAVTTDGGIVQADWAGNLFCVTGVGALNWSRSLGAPVRYSTGLALSDKGTAYVFAEDLRLHAISSAGETLWTFATGAHTDLLLHHHVRPSPTIGQDGTVYFGALDGMLYAIRGDGPPAPSSWPMFRHDAQHTGRMPLLLEATDLNVSVGANVVMRAVTQEQPPVAFQWYHNGNPISNATQQLLSLAQVSADDAGEYYVTMTYINGTAVSQAVRLSVDTMFSKVTASELVNVPDSISYERSGTAWGDYDNDGYLDLFVSVYGNKNLLFHNNGNETFTRVATGSVAAEYAICLGGVWGDYDNDGLLDLFTPNLSAVELKANVLHHNKGTNGFSRLNIWPFVDDIARSVTAAWGDYDNDGFLDLFVGNSEASQVNFLYHNRGDGTFGKVLQGSIVNEVVHSACASWADYDNDGDLDLFVGAESGGINRLYRNNGNGAFTRITSGPVASEGGSSVGCAWGDYDNDGDLDLFVANFDGKCNYLYRNLGNGTFEKVQAGQIVTDASHSVSCCWGDYDNDGFLDLFVANYKGQNDFLYHNNGDGTFTKITSGSIVNDRRNSRGCAWGDYNNDGFLDLFVTSEVGEPNSLYRNNPNMNHWLKLKLIGTSSNRAAIGAKVRVAAAIRGTTIWQLREISGGSGYTSQNALEAHFGLGDASQAAVVQIEWPSGIVQQLKNVLADRFLTVTEPPILTPLGMSWPGEFEFVLTSRGGFSYQIERSEDLQTWMPIRQFYQVNGSVQAVDSEAGLLPYAFYRAVEIPQCGPGLVSWWAGEGNGSDEQGHFDMQAHAGVGYAPGVFGRAFDIDPAGGWLQTAAPAITKTDDWTLDLWVFWRGLDASGKHLVHRPLHIGDLDGYGLFITDTAFCGAESWSCGKEGMLVVAYGGVIAIPTGYYPKPNTWTHLALARSGDVLRVFANGSEVFSKTTGSPKPPTGPVFIGHVNPVETFNGLVDEPRIWSRALVPEEIREIYRVGALRLAVDRR